MATTTANAPGLATRARDDGRNIVLGVAAAFAAAFVAGVIFVGRSGAVAERISNPAIHGGGQRPVDPLWGFHHWITVHQIGLVLMMVTLVSVFVIGWRRKPGNPILLMMLVTTLLIWQDPIMNWAPFAVYNPQIFHWPETWGLASLSPTIEPFIVIGYATFQMGPYFPAVWILRKLQAKRSTDSFVWRHPLVSVAALVLVIGFVFDACLEMFLVRTQLYIYSQVIPFGSVGAGHWYQFPLIWESVMVTFVMIPAGVLLYRDDTGKTQAEKLAQRARMFRGRPVFGAFAVMFLVINVSYFAYGAGFGLIRLSKAATSVACPWTFPEAKVYDPQGFYAKAGVPGPYFEGIWATKPHVATNPDGRCAP
jgi:hypothetical protein